MVHEVVLVTINRKRYVVVEGDDLFDEIPSGPVRREARWDGPHFYFGGRWMRGFGRVDEMYRSLSASEVTKVERQSYDRVFGQGCTCGCGAR